MQDTDSMWGKQAKRPVSSPSSHSSNKFVATEVVRRDRVEERSSESGAWQKPARRPAEKTALSHNLARDDSEDGLFGKAGWSKKAVKPMIEPTPKKTHRKTVEAECLESPEEIEATH